MWKTVERKLVSQFGPNTGKRKAAEWREVGFTSDRAEEWILHGVYDPEEAMELENRDLEPSDDGLHAEWW